MAPRIISERDSQLTAAVRALGLPVDVDRMLTLERAENGKARIAVVGMVSRGKSTLVNQLVGVDICPTDSRGETVANLIISPRPQGFQGRVQFDSGPEKSFKSLDRFRASIARDRNPWAITAEAELPCRLPEHLDLVDTPGVDDPQALAKSQNLDTRWLAAGATGAVVVTAYPPGVGASDIGVIESAINTFGRNVIVVVKSTTASVGTLELNEVALVVEESFNIRPVVVGEIALEDVGDWAHGALTELEQAISQVARGMSDAERRELSELRKDILQGANGADESSLETSLTILSAMPPDSAFQARLRRRVSSRLFDLRAARQAREAGARVADAKKLRIRSTADLQKLLKASTSFQELLNGQPIKNVTEVKILLGEVVAAANSGQKSAALLLGRLTGLSTGTSTLAIGGKVRRARTKAECQALGIDPAALATSMVTPTALTMLGDLDLTSPRHIAFLKILAREHPLELVATQAATAVEAQVPADPLVALDVIEVGVAPHATKVSHDFTSVLAEVAIGPVRAATIALAARWRHAPDLSVADLEVLSADTERALPLLVHAVEKILQQRHARDALRQTLHRLEARQDEYWPTYELALSNELRSAQGVLESETSTSPDQLRASLAAARDSEKRAVDFLSRIKTGLPTGRRHEPSDGRKVAAELVTLREARRSFVTEALFDTLGSPWPSNQALQTLAEELTLDKDLRSSCVGRQDIAERLLRVGAEKRRLVHVPLSDVLRQKNYDEWDAMISIAKVDETEAESLLIFANEIGATCEKGCEILLSWIERTGVELNESSPLLSIPTSPQIVSNWQLTRRYHARVEGLLKKGQTTFSPRARSGKLTQLLDEVRGAQGQIRSSLRRGHLVESSLIQSTSETLEALRQRAIAEIAVSELRTRIDDLANAELNARNTYLPHLVAPLTAEWLSINTLIEGESKGEFREAADAFTAARADHLKNAAAILSLVRYWMERNEWELRSEPYVLRPDDVSELEKSRSKFDIFLRRAGRSTGEDISDCLQKFGPESDLAQFAALCAKASTESRRRYFLDISEARRRLIFGAIGSIAIMMIGATSDSDELTWEDNPLLIVVTCTPLVTCVLWSSPILLRMYLRARRNSVPEWISYEEGAEGKSFLKDLVTRSVTNAQMLRAYFFDSLQALRENNPGP